MTENPADAPSICLSGAKPPKKLEGSKVDALRQLLSRRNGATLSQLQSRLAWQPHTVRAAISRLRRSWVSIELDRSGRVARYRVVHGPNR